VGCRESARTWQSHADVFISAWWRNTSWRNDSLCIRVIWFASITPCSSHCSGVTLYIIHAEAWCNWSSCTTNFYSGATECIHFAPLKMLPSLILLKQSYCTVLRKMERDFATVMRGIRSFIFRCTSCVICASLLYLVENVPQGKGKGEGFPYSIPSVGTGADPGVQAVSPQTFCQACGYLPSRRASPPFGRYQVILLGDRGTQVWTKYPRLIRSVALSRIWTRDLFIASPTLYPLRHCATLGNDNG